MTQTLVVEVERVEQLTHNVKGFILNLLGEKFDYLPGQFLQLILPIEKDACDNRCNVRPYSIASSPTETAKTGQLMVATKFTTTNPSVFKQYLDRVKVGDRLQITGPFGRFTLGDDYSKDILLIAGGIGITPFRSMIKFAQDKNLPLNMCLLYSNKTIEDIVWRKEFENIALLYPRFKLVNTLTDQTDNLDDWQGEIGLVSERMIKRYVNNLANTVFYLCGPQAMILEMGVGLDQIKTELFSGY